MMILLFTFDLTCSKISPTYPWKIPVHFTNSLWRNFFICRGLGKFGYLLRVCGPNHWLVKLYIWILFVYFGTLKLTANRPKRKRPYSNHPFSGAKILVSALGPPKYEKWRFKAPKIWVVPVKIMKVPKVPMEVPGISFRKFYHQVDLRYLRALMERKTRNLHGHCWVFRRKLRSFLPSKCFLVGGWTNPSERY